MEVGKGKGGTQRETHTETERGGEIVHEMSQ